MMENSITKKCPFCAEEVLAEAKKCRHCGEFFATNANRGHLLTKVTGAVGSLFLLIAPFGPFVSVPIIGRVTLFQQGKGDGVVLIVVALIAEVLSLFGRYGFLWVSGALGVFELGNLLFFFYRRLPETISDYIQKTTGNPFSSIGSAAFSAIEPDWGALVLLLGTLATIGVLISVAVRRRKLTASGWIGAVMVILALAYQAVMIMFPYLKAWPSLLGL